MNIKLYRTYDLRVTEWPIWIYIKSNINKIWKDGLYNGKLIIISNDEQVNFIGYSNDNGRTINLTGNNNSKWNSICFGNNKYIICVIISHNSYKVRILTIFMINIRIISIKS